jgi:hypothetical protein
MSQIFRAKLYNAQQANAALNALYQTLKPNLLAEQRYELTVKPATRSSDANARLHSMLNDVARQVDWAGKKRSVDTWKRLITASWLRATNEQVEILPALDGHGIDVIFKRTSRMTGAQVSSLMEFMEAWGVENGVRFSAPEYQKETTL